MKKKDRPSVLSKCYGKFLNLDMFGEQISFNIKGRTHYQTWCGVLFTLAIILATIGYGYLAAVREMSYHEVPTILNVVKEDFYAPGRD